MFYGRLAYTVSDSGLHGAHLLGVRHFSFDDILRVACAQPARHQLRGADAARAAPVLEPARRATSASAI